MFVNPRFSEVSLMANPEHVVAITRAPQRAERIAEAKIDAAHLAPGEGDGKRVRSAQRFEVRIDQSFQRLETAFIFLPNPRFTHRASLHFDEIRANAWTILPSDTNPLPAGAAMLPLFMKKASLAERRAQTDKLASRNRQHRPNRAIEIFRHTGRFIDHQQIDAGKRPDGLFLSRQADDARMRLELQAGLIESQSIDRPSDRRIALDHLAKQ